MHILRDYWTKRKTENVKILARLPAFLPDPVPVSLIAAQTLAGDNTYLYAAGFGSSTYYY